MKPAIDKCAEMIRTGQVIKAIHDVFAENPELPAIGDTSDPHDDHQHSGTHWPSFVLDFLPSPCIPSSFDVLVSRILHYLT